ncbi:ABC transporter permease [Solibacillus sp. R5-41]|uniref:lmo0954 family membrane protein n=1 Tax=Solibacillus sp. R5-41 TaxID=2048654 RepID=UPI000C1263FC|nr:ABC transporter permease [Solibacillus sp. R5-41]ATP39559.1 ABC transporter permease [Solibacillus sp. R5-41]
MKKLFVYTAGFFAALVALVLLAPVAGLLVSGLLLAAGLHYYTESTSTFGKVMSLVLALAGLISALSNIPGFIGLVAIAILYYIYKSRKNEKVEIFSTTEKKEEDPFTNFEREWAKLNN